MLLQTLHWQQYMERGKHNKYFWFQIFETDFSMDRFIDEFKQHLIGKYIAVTSYDSGELYLSDEEKEAGWEYINNLAVSPLLKLETKIPTAGFDEWYVFSELPPAIKLTDVYVNYGAFHLKENSDLLKNFWQQIELNQPIIYIADGDSLKILTTDLKLKQAIENNWS